MIACDAHMHTRFSEDSDASVHSMLDAAVNKGMQAVCITDHLDKDFPETPDFPAGAFMFDLDEYFSRLTQLKTEYQKKLEVRIGVEIGLQPHLGEYYKELTVNEDGSFTFSDVKGAQEKTVEATAELKTQSKYGDYQGNGTGGM